MPYYIIQQTWNDFGNPTLCNPRTPFVHDYEHMQFKDIHKLLEPKQSYWNPKSFGNMHHLKLLRIDKIHLLHDPQTYS